MEKSEILELINQRDRLFSQSYFFDKKLENILRNLFFWELRNNEKEKISQLFERKVNSHNLVPKKFFSEDEKKEGLKQLIKFVGTKELLDYLEDKKEVDGYYADKLNQVKKIDFEFKKIEKEYSKLRDEKGCLPLIEKRLDYRRGASPDSGTYYFSYGDTYCKLDWYDDYLQEKKQYRREQSLKAQAVVKTLTPKESNDLAKQLRLSNGSKNWSEIILEYDKNRQQDKTTTKLKTKEKSDDLERKR